MTGEPADVSASYDGVSGPIALLHQELIALTGIATGAALMLGTLTEIGRSLHAYSGEMAPIMQAMPQIERSDDTFAWQPSHRARGEAHVPSPHAMRHPKVSLSNSYQAHDRRVDAQLRLAGESSRPAGTETFPSAPDRPVGSKLKPPAPDVVRPGLDALVSQSPYPEPPEGMTSPIAPYSVSPKPPEMVTAEHPPQTTGPPASQPFLAPKKFAARDDTSIDHPQPIVVLRTPIQPADRHKAASLPSSVPGWQTVDDTMQQPGPSAAQSARQSAEPGQQGSIPGTIYIDASQLGRWVVDYLSRQVARPANGITGIDPRITPTFPGAPNGA